MSQKINDVDDRKATIDLTVAVRKAVECNRSAIGERSQTLILSLPRQAVRVMGDARRLERLLASLLYDACMFGRVGGTVSIKLELPPAARDANPEARVRVRADGLGVEVSLLPRNVDFFSETNSSRARERGGLGIGLTLVQRLVAFHGGTFEARSAGSAAGGEFVVCLPLVTADPTNLPMGPSVAKLRSAFPRAVLVVDDNHDSAETLGMVLRVMDHRVSVTFGADEALAVEPGTFDVALIDIVMPGKNGLELAAAIRERDDTPRPKLIAITGYGDSEMRQCVKSAGFDHHLLKPADSQVLFDLLEPLT